MLIFKLELLKNTEICRTCLLFTLYRLQYWCTDCILTQKWDCERSYRALSKWEEEPTISKENSGLRTTRPLSIIVYLLAITEYVCRKIWYIDKLVTNEQSRCLLMDYLAPGHLWPSCWHMPIDVCQDCPTKKYSPLFNGDPEETYSVQGPFY